MKKLCKLCYLIKPFVVCISQEQLILSTVEYLYNTFNFTWLSLVIMQCLCDYSNTRSSFLCWWGGLVCLDTGYSVHNIIFQKYIVRSWNLLDCSPTETASKGFIWCILMAENLDKWKYNNWNVSQCTLFKLCWFTVNMVQYYNYWPWSINDYIPCQERDVNSKSLKRHVIV